MRRVLVVEDDEEFAHALLRRLGESGFLGVVARRGEEGLELARQGGFDLVVLDLNLPGMDGFQVLTALRAGGPYVPVLVLSGREDELDKVMALDLGADDYVTKPFAPRELVARLRALLRRRTAPRRVWVGNVEVDLDRRVVRRDGKPLRLSPTALTVLYTLLRAEEAVVSREELFVAARPGQSFGSRRVVDNAVLELRRVLEPDPRRPRHLLTIRNLGYRLVLRVPDGGD